MSTLRASLGPARPLRPSLIGPISVAEPLGRDRSCPRWCDGRHTINDDTGTIHGVTVAQLAGAKVSISWVENRDPRHGDSAPLIFVGENDTVDGIVILEQSDATTLLTVLDQTTPATWLADSLRAALTLLAADH